MSTRTIGQLTPVVTLLPTALIEIEQGGNSFSATIQEALDLIIVANVGAGSGIFKDESPDNTFNLKSIIGGTNITLVAGADDITINSDVVTGLVSLNADTTAAQIIAGTAGRISLVDAGATHTFDIDATYVGQVSITTLGTITTGVWNGTDIAIANIANGTANQIIKTNAGGTALEFGLITTANISATAGILLTQLEALTSTNIIVGSVTNVATSVAMTGDITISNTGVTSIGTDKVTNDDIIAHTSTKITITAKGQLNSAIVYNDQANVFGDFIQTFKDNSITIESPDGLTPTTLVNAQQTLARNLTIPILTANRSIVVTGEASQITIGTEVTGASTALTDTANIARNSDNLSFFSATSSAQLAGVISDETGTGLLVFGTSPTIVTPTIASFANATHDHADAAGGGQILSTSALSDTADITYLNTVNSYIAGNRQNFLGLLAGTAGLNVGALAGNPTTQVDGDMWYNSSTNTMFGRVNGVNIDLGAAGAGAPPFADTTSIIEGSADPTKELRFEIDGFTTATVRVITPPDADITLVNTSNGLIADAQTDTFTTTKISTTNKALLNSAIAYTDQANTFGDFAQIFADNQIFIQNPAATATFQISAPGIAANKTITLPLLLGNDIFVTEAFAQPLTNKTMTAAANTFSGFAIGTEVTGASTDLTDTAVIGRSTDNLGFFAATTSAQLAGVISDETGSGLLVFGTSPVLVTPALGVPTALTLTNATGLPPAGVTGVAAVQTDNLSVFAATTSAQLAGVISDETGSGLLVFGTAPTIDSPSLSYAINAQTGTTYTPVLLDAGKIITSSNAAAVTVTIPPNSSVAYPIGSSLTIISIGVGLTSFAQGAGVTITSTGAVSTAPVLRAQHSSATAIKTATDTWRVVGDIV